MRTLSKIYSSLFRGVKARGMCSLSDKIFKISTAQLFQCFNIILGSSCTAVFGTITPPSHPAPVEVFVDDKRVLVPPGTTVLQACAAAGVEIPR